ncbi:hypothetical protein C1I97_18040 [Streptomyces sp. NTH33]|uniref:hypothetical protein n=1 Tax=Streptomyces sp. NTH33 TaxID=1735453 RepID=UPI000DAAC333|nr:hypothetical protein [Streptomyces sp. NTH33]PZH06816.1 hypothetical protein C1I97_18040 [Streptomyces sp. NTH33]
MMKKLMRHIATTGVSAAVVGGVLLAGGGPAAAADSRAAGHTAARTPVADTAHHVSEHRAGRPHVDPWVAGQLAWFYPSAAKRLAVYDPWVKDQLALVTPSAGTRAG